MSTSEYAKLADAIAADIVNGVLKPGDRLPPQRAFAYQHDIAVSTASRVYAELLRRRLVVGEVGRGTFVSGQSGRGVEAPGEPRGIRIDLEFNYPILPGQTALIAKSLKGLDAPAPLEAALRQATSVGTEAARNIGAAFLAQGSWSPDADQLVFAGNGRQAIAAALAALVPTGGRCGVETLTYPFIKGIASRLGITLVPLTMDEDGVRPDSVEKAHREARLSALYVQPAVQNPLGITMPLSRRTDLLRVAEALGIMIIEDRVYGFLDDAPPLAALAPNACVVVDSLSKRVAPGLSLGFIIPPPHLREDMKALVRSPAHDGGRHGCRAGQAETARRPCAPEACGRASLRVRDSGERELLSPLADAPAALALAELRRRGGQAGRCANPFDDLCGHSGPCAQCRQARIGDPGDGPARYGAAHPGCDTARA